MPIVSDEIKNTFKTKITEAVAQLIIYGLGILLAWSVFMAMSGKQDMTEGFENLNIRMTNEFNESVKRDADFEQRLETMYRDFEELYRKAHGGQAKPPNRRLPGDPKKDYYDRYYRPHMPMQQQQMVPQMRSRKR